MLDVPLSCPSLPPFSFDTHPTNADAFVHEFTHFYSDALLAGIVQPISSDLKQSQRILPGADAGNVEHLDGPDFVKRTASFELNPLQLQLQDAWEGNLLCGTAFSFDDDMDVGLDITSTPPSPSSSPPKSCSYTPRHSFRDPDGASDSDLQSDTLTDSDEELEPIEEYAEQIIRPCVVRRSLGPTIYEEFTKKGLDWCRYCGVTKGGQTNASFRPGPWGKRTLCNKHGCDYKGYGYADKQSRLDLSSFHKETVEERCRPILQDFCITCFQRDSAHSSLLVQCDGCPRAYHPECYDRAQNFDGERWFCEPACANNRKVAKIVLDLPKRRLPYMTPGHHDRGYTKRDSVDLDHRRSSVSSEASSSYTSSRRDSGMDMTLPCGYSIDSDGHLRPARYHPYTRGSETCR
ncbi:hypothetical protein HKX48_001491 [Thoreauomyces humboldtii]|nr:hypothetical protein HKX48_001491 [Thoreauomyces humboldtii]